MPDFNLKTYLQLLKALRSEGFSFLTFAEYLNCKAEGTNIPRNEGASDAGVRRSYVSQAGDSATFGLRPGCFVILRHDVDALQQNSLQLARLENSLGIKGTYYFRMVPGSFDADIIKEISRMGHEIGYHYETMDTVSKKKIPRLASGKTPPFTKGDETNPTSRLWQDTPFTKGNEIPRLASGKTPPFDKGGRIPAQMIDEAYELFVRNLEIMRKIVPIQTISAHGSPLSKYDNKAIWGKYDYRALGIFGDPFIDVDFSEVAYLTDTGRRWNGAGVSIRDKINSNYNFNFRSTKNIILKIHQLPTQVMFTIHPQRWTDSPIAWTKELIFQNFKNIIKWTLLKVKK